MSKLLFVSDIPSQVTTLQNLGGRLEISSAAYGAVQDIGGTQLIICDLGSNYEACRAEVSRLRVLCGFRDIPILVAAADDDLSEVRRLNRDGANSVLRKPFNRDETLSTIEAALQPVGIRTKIDMGVVTPFIDATVSVIRTMTGEDVRRTDLFLRKSYAMFGDVSGVMGLMGATEGVVVLTFHQDLAYSLVARMVGCADDELSMEEASDGIGEIVNMISGNAKAEVGKIQKGFNVSLPTVIIGHGHQIAHRRNQPLIAIVFECLGSPFAVQLCVSSESHTGEPDSAVAGARKAGMPG